MKRLNRQISATVLSLWDVYGLRVAFCTLCCFHLLDIWAFNVYASTNARTDQSGITVEFNLPKLEISTVKRDGVRYQAVSFDGSGFTNEAGNPRLPVSRVMLGVPPDVGFHVEILHATTETRSGYRIPPVPHNVPKPRGDNFSSPSHPENFQTLKEEWREDGPAYQSTSNYPKVLAQAVYDGYIRSQRVLYLELCPVQYQPKSKLLRVHSRMTVRVHFVPQGTANKFQSLSTSSSQSAIAEPGSFERMYQSFLLNYVDAKHWRVPTNLPEASRHLLNSINQKPTRNQPGIQGTVPAGPAVREQTIGERYKILVDKTGIYRLTNEDLRRKWGIDLNGIDPRRLHLRTNNREVPIYVYGEEDGRFDPGDFVEFLGIDAKNRYTRWNVYWLGAEATRGVRISEIHASPDDPAAKLIPSFRSKLYFEENHLHSNLRHVEPNDVSPDDKHGWFAALDFWYWTGVKNLADANEVDLEFPLYDLTQSFDQPNIRVTLQGGTPTDHEALVSINNIRIDEVKWRDQDVATVGRTLRVWNNLRDATKGEKNVITLARVDTTEEENTLAFPYHVYINSFEVEYTRLLKAVNDALEFTTPAGTDPHSVRKRRRLEYTIQTFLSPDVAIFEHDGTVLVSKLQNLKIERVDLDRTERNRLREIYRVNAEADDVDQPSLQDIPRVAYNATFQVRDAHDAKYIAVSAASVRQPVRVEAATSSDLLSPANGADYVIITHPVFLEASKRLAQWRSTQKGGGYRTKVVDVTQIYDIFSNGMVNPQAIKDFLTYAYKNWAPPALSYVAIMGDGTYDHRGIDEELYPEPPELAGYIPTHYIWTTSFGKTSVDHWYTTVNGIDELPDFYIGRLSVETLEEAENVVDKLISYDDKRPNGDWRRRILSVADDEINNSGDQIFQRSLTALSESQALLGYETVPIYLEDVINTVEANRAAYPELPQRVAKDMIIDAMSDGAVIAQYAGHGGRIVWAHEAIFDNRAIDQVSETDHLPFMLVLSCYNGYFDAPGEPSMAEKLLRKDRSGIIAMLSATRLTYGSGNDTLNTIIFDMIFQRNIRQLGPISFDSKIEQLIEDGRGQLNVMLEYTLFGDPAMNLAMADYEVQADIETDTVTAGQLLKIAPGQIVEVSYDPTITGKRFTPISNFNGKIYAKAVFPGTYSTVEGEEGPLRVYSGDVPVAQEAAVVNGQFPGLSLPVPKGISAGQGHVEFYAESTTHIAASGSAFTVRVPKILDIQPELVAANPGSEPSQFRISVQVSDELNEAGIRSVLLEWRDPVQNEWLKEAMIRDTSRGNGWYTTPKPLPLSDDRSSVRYEITVVDIDNRQVSSGRQTYRPFVFPDVRVTAGLRFAEPLIYYGYSREDSAWTINADIEQIVDIELKERLEVAFFEGNPDRDRDGVVDTGAKLLGKTQIPPSAWQRRNPVAPHKNVIKDNGETDSLRRPRAFRDRPLNTNWIATATLKHELPIGNHEIFVFVDPAFDETELPYAKLREGDERDNIESRLIHVQSVLIGQNSQRVFSQDTTIDFRIPARAVPELAVLTITPLNNQQRPQPVNPSSLIPVALPNGDDTVAYSAMLDTTAPDQIGTPLQQPITAELRFDRLALQEAIKAELGLEEISNPAPDQIVTIDEGVESVAKGIGMYLWIDALKNWARLDSELVTSSDGLMDTQSTIANISASNHGDGELQTVRVDPASGRVGKWVLLFTSSETYRVLISEEERPLELIDPDRFVDPSIQAPGVFSDGVALGIDLGEKDFQFGDVLTFHIFDTSSGSSDPTFYPSSFREQNFGRGSIQYIHLEENSSMPLDRWVILFIDSEHFQVEGETHGPLSRNGQPLLGKLGNELVYPEFGLRLKISASDRAFEAGDSFRFSTKETGRIRAEVPMFGTLTLMQSNDTIPPDLQLTIGKQNFIDGDPVSSEPFIQATLTDDNGIDYVTRPVHLEISRDNQSFTLISETEYRLSNVSGSNQVNLNYQSSKLEPGIYRARLSASDLDGNASEEEIEFRVHKILQLLRAMNYPNPFDRETEITCELTGAADELIVKIYSLSGRLVHEFTEPARAGFTMISWDGRDREGDEVANGVYYCKIRVKMAGEKDLTEYIKMMKLK